MNGIGQVGPERSGFGESNCRDCDDRGRLRDGGRQASPVPMEQSVYLAKIFRKARNFSVEWPASSRGAP